MEAPAVETRDVSTPTPELAALKAKVDRLESELAELKALVARISEQDD